MKNFGVWIVAAALCVVSAGSAEAQRFGAAVSYGSDSDFGVGGRLEFDMTGKLSKNPPLSRAFFIGQVDVYFPDCGTVDCTWIEINPSFAVPITATTLNPYLGAGLNIARVSVSSGGVSNSNTEMGINLLGGLKFGLGDMSAFSEARLSLGGGEQFALSFGILFGGAGK